jgi:2,4-dienoyl-CoA reductase-like NADH-dependent reductase (Old Yellow Enzyme family)
MTEKVQRDSTKQREAFFLAFAHRAKQEASKMPIMLTGTNNVLESVCAATKLLMLGGIRSRLVMENIIKTDQADVIGLGRPFAVNLSALQGLLDGTTDFLPSKDISTGSKLLDVRLLFVVVAVF